MNFGLYIGSVAGTDKELAVGKPDDPSAIHASLNQIEQGLCSLIIRGYLHYLGNGQLGNEAPENIIQHATTGRKIDLVLCYRSATYNQQDWTNTVRNVLQRFGKHLCSIQITEEPNLKDAFAGDGGFENIDKALHDGVLAAKAEVNKLGYPIKVGFNTVLSFDPADNFWNMVGCDAYKLFREAIDYVGLDFFPDVFKPLPDDGFPGNLKEAVKYVLRHFRNTLLNIGKIPATVPIHITENGWSTGGGRSFERQAIVMETIVRALHDVADELNIQRYEWFGLRDTDSSNDNLFYQFGIVKDDYSPKPAFYKFGNLIQEFSGQ